MWWKKIFFIHLHTLQTYIHTVTHVLIIHSTAESVKEENL